MAEPTNVFSGRHGINTEAKPTDARFQVREGQGGALREAENVDLATDGTITGRAGRVLVRERHNVTSMFSIDGNLYYVADGVMWRYDEDGDVRLGGYFTPDRRVERARFGGVDFFSDGTYMARLHGDALLPWRVPETGGISAQPVAEGGLPDGQYVLTYTLVVDGIEGGAVEAKQVTLAPGEGGIEVLPVVNPALVDYLNVYLSHPGGQELFLVGSKPVASFVIDRLPDVQKAADVLSRRQPPLGDVIRSWNGFMIVMVRDEAVYFSEPLNPFTFRVASDFIMIPGVRSVEPCGQGFFVWTSSGEVQWYSGDRPANLTVRRVTSAQLVEGATLRVNASRLPMLEGLGDVEVPVWMSEWGFAIGRPDGNIVFPKRNEVHSAAGWVHAIEARGHQGFEQLVASQSAGAGVNATVGDELVVQVIKGTGR